MHAGKISLIVVCSIIAIAAFAFVYANRKSKEQTKTNQDPQYLIEARKNIVGVWYEEDNPKIGLNTPLAEPSLSIKMAMIQSLGTK